MIAILGIAYALGIPFDYWLAASKRKTISLRVWLAEKAHPTLILGVAAAGWVLYLALLPNSPGVAGLVMLTCGHFCTTEGAAIALITPKHYARSPFKARIPKAA
jgi:hypothetical protein